MAALGSDDFGTSLDGYYFFINDDEWDITKGGPNKKCCQFLPYYPELDDITDNRN